ncbi:MAG: hypothetical protein WA047_18930 [Phenylobacterium sp.]|uniref:DUF7684 family protein n=1 Tax=Phenylobacterium sp. TaxID=1871053 RepID=UPI003BB6C7F5
MPISYLHLPHGQEPPDFGPKRPYRAVVVVEQNTSPEWRAKVSDWLVQSGCLYMMAWGLDSSAWDDSVDWANLIALGGPEALGGEEISDDDFVITTWHDDEPLSETFWFSEHTAHHPTIPIDETIIVDVGPTDRGISLLEMLKAAQQRTM